MPNTRPVVNHCIQNHKLTHGTRSGDEGKIPQRHRGRVGLELRQGTGCTTPRWEAGKAACSTGAPQRRTAKADEARAERCGEGSLTRGKGGTARLAPLNPSTSWRQRRRGTAVAFTTGGHPLPAKGTGSSRQIHPPGTEDERSGREKAAQGRTGTGGEHERARGMRSKGGSSRRAKGRGRTETIPLLGQPTPSPPAAGGRGRTPVPPSLLRCRAVGGYSS